MNILFVGHDIAYVNFYIAIESALRQRIELSSLHLYSRPSAWLYSRLLLRLPSRSPSLIRLFGRWLTYNNTHNEFIDLRFYQASSGANQRYQFERIYKGYFSFIQKTLSGNDFDLAVLPGEYRLFEQATIAVLESLKRTPQIIYFEAGPPGYVYLDKCGVNANASFANTGVSDLLVNITSQITTPTIAHGTLYPLTRKGLLFLDIMWLWLTKITSGLLDLEEFWVAMKNRLRIHRFKRSKVKDQSDTLLMGSYIIFIGQVRNDINNTHFGIAEIELEQRLIEILSSDLSIKMIWRDHPLEFSEKLFQKLSDAFPDRVFRLDKVPLKTLLASVQGVVTVNSNAGLEALASGLPVRLLGRSYFSKLQGVCVDNFSFEIFRKKIKESGPDQAIRRDAERFLKECFLPIDYRGGDFRNAHLAAEVIISCKI